MLIKEFRVILPMTVEEYQVAQLWSVAEASKNETGGGEGIEVLNNEPFTEAKHVPQPELLNGDPRFQTGQYTYKIYHLINKVPRIVRYLAPKEALQLEEKAWNAYPYCRTVLTNPGYMKDKFFIKIESMHIGDDGTSENAHQLPADVLAKREVIIIDIANDDLYAYADYKADQDPKLFRSQKTDRGPLINKPWWKDHTSPIMCAYKLVYCDFKWFGLQSQIEKTIMKQEKRIFTNFHRMVFCWMDKWFGLTMEDIRAIEDRAKKELDEQLRDNVVRGTVQMD